jgi:hypothetical protein
LQHVGERTTLDVDRSPYLVSLHCGKLLVISIR